MGAAASRIGERRIALCLGLVAATFFLLVQQGAITGSDGASVYAVTRSIVDDGDISVEPEFGVAGRNGDYYSKYGIGLSVLGVVPYALVRPVAELYDRPDALEQAAVASLLPLISALLVVALFALCRRLGAGVRSSILVALGAVVGTFLIVYTKEFFGEPLVALFLVIALERALAGRPGQSGLALAAGALVRPEAFVFSIVLVPYLALTRGRSAFVRAVIPLVAVLAFTLAYNHYRFSGATDTGYGSEDAKAGNPLRGTAGLLITPEKSLFLFAPVVVLAPFAFARLWRKSRGATALLAGTVVVGFVTVASVPGWDGGWSWGPRHLIAVVPVLLAPCALWLDSNPRKTGLFVALCVLGLAISAAALVVSTRAQQLDTPSPSSPRIWRQYELIPRTIRYSSEHTGDKSQDDHRRYVDLWQVGAARELGRKGFLLAVPITALLAILAVWSAIALFRAIPGRTAARRPGRGVAGAQRASSS